MDSCCNFENCSAPLCPLSRSSLESGIWFPGEPVCKKRGIEWVRIQKKIDKVAKEHRNHGFTYEMLLRINRVKEGIRGIDPDNNIAAQVKAWLKRHPERPISMAPEHNNVHVRRGSGTLSTPEWVHECIDSYMSVEPCLTAILDKMGMERSDDAIQLELEFVGT